MFYITIINNLRKSESFFFLKSYFMFDVINIFITFASEIYS